MTQFSELGLAAPLLKTLEELGYDAPTPIQTQAIPSLMEGRDLLGIAQTGTGKTAAFALPILHHLNASQKDGEREKKSVRTLILAPTRELAIQISDSCREYSKLLGLKVVVVVGGVPIARQIKQLERGTDVLIATPGRLEDLQKQKAVRLDKVTHLVLDEADQMLDMGFIHVLKRIASCLPRDRQTLLFSATMPKEIEALAGNFLRDPVHVSVAPVSSTAERVTQAAYFVKQKDKPVLLAKLLKAREVSRAIVFTRTKHGANRLVSQLDKANLDALAIHGNKTQNQRQKALNAFKAGECAILVATDVAARGIDIPYVSHVYNFDLPEVPEQYVHRIGRTARAGESGDAIALISDGERDLLRQIERLTKIRLEVLPLPDDFKEELASQAHLIEPSHRDRRAAEFSSGREGGERSGRGDQKGRRGQRAERQATRRDHAEQMGFETSERPRRERSDRNESGERRERSSGQRSERSGESRKPASKGQFQGRRSTGQSASNGKPRQGGSNTSRRRSPQGAR